jgi:hypothetical protein
MSGRADDLNARLNSNSGSLDNFLNTKRKADAERNFVKKLCDVDVLRGLQACFVTEDDVCAEFSLTPALSELDRGNVEKFLNVIRGLLPFSRDYSDVLVFLNREIDRGRITREQALQMLSPKTSAR